MLTDGWTDAPVTGILIAHLGAFGSGELIITILHTEKILINFMLTVKCSDNVPVFSIEIGSLHRVALCISPV